MYFINVVHKNIIYVWMCVDLFFPSIKDPNATPSLTKEETEARVIV